MLAPTKLICCKKESCPMTKSNCEGEGEGRWIGEQDEEDKNAGGGDMNLKRQ